MHESKPVKLHIKLTLLFYSIQFHCIRFAFDLEYIPYGPNDENTASHSALGYDEQCNLTVFVLLLSAGSLESFVILP